MNYRPPYRDFTEHQVGNAILWLLAIAIIGGIIDLILKVPAGPAMWD